MTAVSPEQAAYEAFQASRAARNPMMPVTAWTHPAVDSARDHWAAAAQAGAGQLRERIAQLAADMEADAESDDAAAADGRRDGISLILLDKRAEWARHHAALLRGLLS